MIPSWGCQIFTICRPRLTCLNIICSVIYKWMMIERQRVNKSYKANVNCNCWCIALKLQKPGFGQNAAIAFLKMFPLVAAKIFHHATFWSVNNFLLANSFEIINTIYILITTYTTIVSDVLVWNTDMVLKNCSLQSCLKNKCRYPLVNADIYAIFELVIKPRVYSFLCRYRLKVILYDRIKRYEWKNNTFITILSLVKHFTLYAH